ncbi:AMP-binding protein [Nakamurella sp. PAMC28650]|nr:AMP-binding protein [Nakamurella sp. PAMC28650]
MTFPGVSAFARRAYSDTGLWDGELLDDYLFRCASRTPDRPAVIDADSRISYGQLARRVTAVAAGLRGLGVGRGDVVSIQLPNWWEAMVVHFAAISIGAVSNPTMPILRDRDLAFMVGSARAKVLVVAADYRNHDHGAMALRLGRELPGLEHVVTVRGRREGALAFDELLASAPEGGTPEAGRSADDPVVLLYTSGTESSPKGAVHSHNTLGYENRTMIELFELTADDVVWAPSPIAHITGVLFALHLPTMLDCAVALQDIWEPTTALELIQAERCTFVVAATPFLHGLTYHPELSRFDVGCLRVFVCGGADVPPTLIADAGERLGVRAVRLYGSTEIPTVTSSAAGAPLDRRARTDGRAIADADIVVVDDEGRPVPIGTVGRLRARGPEAMLGYLGLDRDPFDPDGWFDTGDLGSLDEGGYVTMAGRSKDIILRGGENISAKEVEDLLGTHPAIADVAVVSMPDPRLTERACAVVVLRPGASLELSDLTAHLDALQVARQKYPERLEFVDELPRTPTGKVQKFALRTLVAERLT